MVKGYIKGETAIANIYANLKVSKDIVFYICECGHRLRETVRRQSYRDQVRRRRSYRDQAVRRRRSYKDQARRRRSYIYHMTCSTLMATTGGVYFTVVKQMLYSWMIDGYRLLKSSIRMHLS